MRRDLQRLGRVPGQVAGLGCLAVLFGVGLLLLLALCAAVAV